MEMTNTPAGTHETKRNACLNNGQTDGSPQQGRSPTRILRRLLSTLRDCRGVSAAEYAILAVGVVIVVGTAVATLGTSLADAFATVGTTIANQQSSLSDGSR